jgi:V-type H+-transporting ATPase subunit C
MDAFVVRFKWEDARYPRRKSLNELTEMIQAQVQKLDEELKAKAIEYNNIVNTIQQRKKRETGSLAARDLTNLVPHEDITESEYLSTLLVVVAKQDYKSWEAKYESLVSFVVPRSSKLLYEDNDSGLFRIILFKKVVEEFKSKSRENKFTVRKFEPSEQMSPEEQKKMENDQLRLRKSLTRWCNTNFAEAFIAWIHLKCIRLFVESVLRYGLPARFQAMLILPKPKTLEKLRGALAEMYNYLGSKNYTITAEEEQAGNTEKFYAYVSTDISLDLKYDKE